MREDYSGAVQAFLAWRLKPGIAKETCNCLVKGA